MIKNICHKCVRHEECIKYRYLNLKKEYMKEVEVSNNDDGNPIIYVSECEKFELNQPFRKKILNLI